MEGGKQKLAVWCLSCRHSTLTVLKPCHPWAPEKAPTVSLCTVHATIRCLDIPLSNHSPVHLVGYQHYWLYYSRITIVYGLRKRKRITIVYGSKGTVLQEQNIITWELVRNAYCWLQLQTSWIINSGVVPSNLCFNRHSRWSLCMP